MRILYINNCHYRRGGADVVYFNTADLMTSKGHEVFFYSQKNQENDFVENEDLFLENINYSELPLFSKFKSTKSYIHNDKAASNLELLLNRVKPQIVHLHLFLGGLSVSILKTIKKANIPIVMSVHDYRLLCPANIFLDNNNAICEKCKDGFIVRCMVKKCSDNNFFQSSIITFEAYYRKYFINPIDYIDKFIFVSKFSEKKHFEFDESFKSKSVQIYNFNSVILNQIKISPCFENFCFLYIGRISVEKGVETLLETFMNRNSNLKIVGDGALLNEFKAKYKKNNIEFLGYKDGQELEQLKMNASFVIVPSVCYENNPLSVLESYAIGKPVIGSNIGGIPEIVIDGETGYLFPPGDTKKLSAIIDLAEKLSITEYLTMSKKALNFAKSNFDKDLHYKELMEVYSKLVNKNQ